MLTLPQEIKDAARRLERFGIDAADARAIVADVLGLGTWDQALERAEKGTAVYPDAWLSEAAVRFFAAVDRLKPGAQHSKVSSLLSRTSILDIFQKEPLRPPAGIPSTDLPGLIRFMSASSAAHQLMPPVPLNLGTLGMARSTQKVVEGHTIRTQSVRLAHEGSSKFRIDSWWVTVEDDSGMLGAMTGHGFMPIDSRPVPGEKALLAADTVGKELLCELLAVVGSLPKGVIHEPVASVDYLYVVPRARGQRLTVKMFTSAAQELQRITPRFGTFLIDPYRLLDTMSLPTGDPWPSRRDIERHMDAHFLLPIAQRLKPLKVAMRLREPQIHLGDEQALHVVGQLAQGVKLAQIKIVPEFELAKKRVQSPAPRS